MLSQRQEARLTYSPQEDFLLSELTYSTGQLTSYLYDSFGRLDTVVLPTGKILQPLLTGQTRSQGMQLRAVLRIRNFCSQFQFCFGLRSGSGLKFTSSAGISPFMNPAFQPEVSFGSGFELRSETFSLVPDRIRIRPKVSDPSGSGWIYSDADLQH